MNVQVLDDSSWELDKIKFEKFEGLNEKVSECLKTFGDFYLKKHEAHRIKWVFGMITIDIQISKLNKPYLLTCNLIQLAILQLLESKGPIKIGTISGLLSFDLRQTIHDNLSYNLQLTRWPGSNIASTHTMYYGGSLETMM